MAVVFIGSATGTNSATLPAFNVGDLAVVWSMRRNSSTPPLLPSGWTTITTLSDATNSVSMRIGYRVLQSGDTTTDTWSNGQGTHVHVYRGQHATPIGGFATSSNGSGAGNVVSYPTITMSVGDGSSWVAAGAVINTGGSSLQTAPTGMTNRTNVAGTGEYSTHDTNAGVASWSTQTVSVGGTNASWGTGVVEILSAAGGGGGSSARSFAVIIG